MDLQLISLLRRTQSRLMGYRRWIAITIVGLVAASLLGLLIILPANVGDTASQGLIIAAITGVALIIVLIVTRRSRADLESTARRIEKHYPSLEQRLVTAIDQTSQSPEHRGYLQEKVIHEAVMHGRTHRWEQVISTRQLFAARVAGLLSLLLVGLLSARLVATHTPRLPNSSTTEESTPTSSNNYEIVVDPGNVNVEKGTNLIVVARFPARLPETATLQMVNQAGQTSQLPMNRSLDDPLFGINIYEVNEPLEYSIQYDNLNSETYRIDVFEFPELLQADAHLEYPDYTGQSAKTIADARRVAAVEGTELTWIFHLNKSVEKATLSTPSGETLELTADPQQPLRYRATIPLTKNQRWKLQLVDYENRSNKTQPELIVKVTPNKPPQVKLKAPRDLRVSPLEEVTLEATVSDDFGVERFGIAYSIATTPLNEIELGTDVHQRTEATAIHLLDFEALEAEPDQLVAYHFWAEDFGPEGELRRTRSDMFFAEVRHFEEIFRQGQPQNGQQTNQEQQQQGGSPNSQQAEELAELQKQVINATWTLIRQRDMDNMPVSFAEDTQVVLESQQSALPLLEELAGNLSDEESITHVNNARDTMNRAIDRLTTSANDPSSLDAAILEEQATYQHLLRLRAREFDVVRQSQQSSNSSSSSSSNSNRFQQQLDELELEDDQQRYETQSEAQQQQAESSEQREMRQVISRLKDLARRQADLNEQLKELQTALEEADSDEERERLERQLKRLREQQQELLRDSDELNERIEEANNQSQMEETRQQLEQSREQQQQSSEALEQRNVPEALSAGTRAERQFERMRDELREQAAEQFTEEMREMREQARELDERQQDISSQLDEAQQNPQPGLRPATETDNLQDALSEQQEDLGELLTEMEQTITEAEDAEPLLAQKLYDSFREASRNQTDQNLEATSDLLERGLRDQARLVESIASDSISNLREGIEEAAESVLGNERESLRRANTELGELMRELQNEIDQNSPDEQNGPQQDQQQQDQQQQDQQQQGQQQQDQQQQDQQQQGQQSSPDQQQRRDSGGLLQSMNDSLGTGPITGDDFGEWSDRLRDIEEILEDSELSSRAAQIRDRARGFRREFKRNSEEPQWNLIRELVAQPLSELRKQVAEELIRRSGEREQLVPIDRDAVPAPYQDRVRRYYEALGRGD